jgi:hypothetical protein
VQSPNTHPFVTDDGNCQACSLPFVAVSILWFCCRCCIRPCVLWGAWSIVELVQQTMTAEMVQA